MPSPSAACRWDSGAARRGDREARPRPLSNRSLPVSSTDHPTLPDPPAAAAISAVATGEPSAAGRELVLATIASHAASLLGTARRYSLCADDAQDAYQRALEI